MTSQTPDDDDETIDRADATPDRPDATPDRPDATRNRPDATRDRVGRRRVIAAGASLGIGALAGCSGDWIDTSADGDEAGSGSANGSDSSDGNEGENPALPSIEDPPDVTYVPTHFEAMRRLEPVEAGPYLIEPMVTYPHEFWNVTGDAVESAAPTGTEDVHLMLSVRDPETGAILPAETGLEVVVARAGETGSPYAPWPMISQEMGFHAGDNIPLGEDGTYEIEVRVGPIDARLTGAFAGRFDEAGQGAFEFEFDQAFRDEVIAGIEYIDDESYWGVPGALANRSAGRGAGTGGVGYYPGVADDSDGTDDSGGTDSEDDTVGDDDTAGEDHRGETRWAAGDGSAAFGTYRRDPDEGELPPADALPGTLQAEPVVGDAVLATTLVGRGSRFVDGDAHYLLVSPRTPYNRSMLPMAAFDYRLRRGGADGDAVDEGPLAATLDHAVGYHYGAPLAGVEPGDAVTVAVETVPNVSRHAGYQTAFLEAGEATFTVDLP